MRLKDTIISLLVLLLMVVSGQWSTVNAQIKIGGNVYGGGNAGDTGGSTTVTVREGNFLGDVYGGARMANIAGSAFVNIDGENTPSTSYILINNVYGGNDIAGTIGNIRTVSGESAPLPTALKKVGTTAGLNNIDNTWNAFVRVSSVKSETTGEAPNQTTTTTNHKVYIGNLYGGSNGDYTVTNPTNSGSGKWEIWTTDGQNNVYKNDAQPQLPELGKTYLEIVGGSIIYVFGGGNNATVTDKTVICTDNPSEVVNHIKINKTTGTLVANDATGNNIEELLSDDRITEMGFNPYLSYANSASYQMGSVFGGNNKVAMAIRPTWNLIKGKIRNLYSGGNAGNMTHDNGLLLAVTSNDMEIDNVYGGCRKADVNPDNNRITAETIKVDGVDVSFPADYAARVYITGGNINNVYGGNDISGNVYGGNAVGIHSSINQNVYGGGNGSYAYTDNPNLAGTVEWGDYYYEVGTGESSVEKLNDFRPNAESVSIRISGGSATKPVVIGGAIYCGGNSATLESGSSNAAAELKVGSYVYADNVFLGNNGENMVKESILQTYAGSVTVGGTNYDFSQIDLTDATQMETYMDGAAMGIRPQLVFDKNAKEDAKPEDERDYTKTYKPYSTYFGSLFVGGNVGSLKIPNESDKKLIVDFDDKIVIYNKVVGGCNNAYINSATYNAAYQGGVLLAPDAHGDKLELNFSGLKIQPKRWKIERNDDYTPKLTDGKPTYILDTNNNRQLEWNTVDSRYYDADTKSFREVENVTPGVIGGEGEDASTDDLYRRLAGGNIYGGCYSSGIVNGNVIININASIVDRDIVFDDVAFDDKTGEEKLYGNTYKITERKTGVILGQQGMDVLGRALNVFGGGKGVETEIWGSTTINLNSGYVFQIFGGSEEGAIGKRKTTTTNNVTTDDKDTYGRYVYEYNGAYSTYVNLAGASNKPGVPKSADPKNSDGTPKVDEALAECEFIYGGGFEGPIAGDTHVNLDNGRIFNSFAGSCNADIQGHTETIIGANGFPYVRDYVYGGNDLGGKILRSKDFTSRVRTAANGGYDAIGKVHNTEMLTASAYIEYIKGRAEKIFGGCYGVYDYTSELYDAYFHTNKTGSEGTTPANMGTARTDKGYSKPWMDNAFINFRPAASNSTYTYVGQIYGAGQGYFTEKEENLLQNRSYILIDIPDEIEYYQTTQVFGGGECGGVGMGVAQNIANNAATAHQASAIIDLVRGQLNAVYGGSYMEGITRRTVVNVPAGSTFHGNKIFGGAYGYIEEVERKDGDGNPVLDDEGNAVIDRIPRIDVACDVYEAIVNFNSDKATIDGAIYGGNNACRRTLYGKVNINAPVKGGTHWTGLVNVYGAGYGENTWSQYTEVNLNNGARVQEVYGGGENGLVINKESVEKWKTTQTNLYTALEGYTDLGFGDNENPAPVSSNRLWEVDNTRPKYYNTNVHINRGATVTRYCYGGGLGHGDLAHSGNVYGTTYIDLLGGTVDFDLYAAGTSGSVKDSLAVGTAENKFVASSTAYIEGGKARNVYGGGWAGSVGHHMGGLSASYANDIPGETHVIIGKTAGTSFLDGIPAIERNAYGGGEGGAVWGTTNITLLNGFIGYRHFDTAPTGTFETIQVGNDYYQEKIDDETRQDGRLGTLYDSGCIFGGGYIDNSSVDISNVTMYGGHVRNALFGGGEIAAIGRGVIHEETDANGKAKRTLQGLYKAGSTNVTLFDGHVHRNVFGGGRGYNNLGGGGTLFSDGYVFGKTLVNIHGGIVGTSEGVSETGGSNGNVFGGGDIGYVYSASEEDGKFYVGVKDGTRYDDIYEGYYYKFKLNNGESYNGESADAVVSKGQWEMDGTEYILTEDCKVLVEPRCKVLTAFGEYKVGDYVPISYLNTLGNKNDAAWNNLDKKGIIIYNAVFAGGNTTKGSANEAAFANSTSVFGNATASIHDVYNLDLITLGSGRIGGLYGDGNLTFVDGYRGLNITNYGTDYYTIQQNPQISITDYYSDKYTDRERAYYQLTYICVKDCEDDEGTTYYAESTDHPKASTLTGDNILALFKNQPEIVDANDNINPEYWRENGVCTIYAGRPMNTIQRADFCGVFGSRLVMQGAQDRVPEVIDYTKYTINRVREVSLNKKKFRQSDPETTTEYHGNYFGIYSVVNYLGALTSDVDFKNTVRVTDNSDDSYKQAADGKAYGVATYEDWKKANIGNRKRNNGISHNKVALASGVYLELTTERGTGDELNEKDWGLITGVVELDLINVQTGVGGGFVYAKNEHGVRNATGRHHVTLTALNDGAVTSDDFTYTTSDDTKTEWQSSGNFVHGEQTIIDDCYNISGKYKGADAVPAHYWYIQGQVYVYDQHISVYTGVPNAYSETVDIPLTITAASHGTMKLLDVRPNKYAYYSSNGVDRLKEGQKLNINDVTYQLNDSISYWDWYKLSKAEQRLFVDETYVVVDDCWIGDKEYKEGYVLLPIEYDELKNQTVIQKRKNDNGVVEDVEVPFTKMFRSSNNMSHETGYILTYRVNNPTEWNTWYTPKSGDYKEKNQTGGNDYENGPTYRLTSGVGQLLGQRAYKISDVIAQEVYDTYQTVKNAHSSEIPSDGQAIFEPAYIVTEQIDISGTTTHLYPGAVLPETEAGNYTGKVEGAYVCGKTIQLSATEFIYVNSKMTLDDKNNYLSRVNTDITAIAGKVISNMNELTDEEINALTYDQKKELRTLLQTKRDITSQITPAYYCTTAGLYGGDYYVGNKNYRGLIAWSSMSPEDRTKFTFNYDALDLLIDSKYGKRENGTQQPEGVKYQYDSEAATLAGAQANPAGYSLEQRVDYEATYNGSETGTYNTITLEHNKVYKRTEYEKLPNEQRHYAPINVTDTENDIYVVKKSVTIDNKLYAVGATIDKTAYNKLSTYDQNDRISKLRFNTAGTYYYCREEYTIGENGAQTPVSSASGVSGGTGGSYANTEEVPVGVVIDGTNYGNLVNKQVNFTIHGIAPTETSTLYVSRDSDIDDLSKGKVITVIYEYNYEESDESGLHITPVTERHVVNIHITFKSGSPTVPDIDELPMVIPGDMLGLREPDVIPGATEVTGGGWELFESMSDAESHTNGIPYTPNTDPLYWYQDGYRLAYYALSYIGGKTYSNHVQVKVANYHDLKKVIEDKEHHYYVDIPDLERLKRNPKIYINDAANGASQLKSLFDLSVQNNPTLDSKGLIAGGTFAGHAPLAEQVKNCDNLDFIMRTNINHTGEWTSIANNEGECFEGTLHGDGHYISGLSQSLFNHLCGSVFNLGVTGTFTGAGIAETGSGYVENCWIKSTATAARTSKPVFGTPTGLTTDRPYRIVNCYYQENDNATYKYTNHPSTSTYGIPTRKAEHAFYNGEVTYDLNGFYLYKRYTDKHQGSSEPYKYYTVNEDNTLSDPKDIKYGANPNYCYAGYVENRYADGDFRYEAGVIPETKEDRQLVDEDGVSHFYPIWPDDYLYFGQMLTYRWNESRPHEDVPSPIVKNSGRLLDNDLNNRVYRAPAYFGNSTMSVVHFNPAVNLVAYSKPLNATDTNLKKAYPGMTAIDFAGHTEGHSSDAYKLGLNGTWFYQPLLDDDGLLGISNRDETPNLLAYAPTAVSESGYANSKTYAVLNSYFKEPDYNDYYQGGNYRCVTDATKPSSPDILDMSSVHGHLVQSNMQATTDHLLVDKQDFNAPFGYQFDTTHCMWYQRTPDNFVDTSKGWDVVSLPFSAELVTTQQKGEITHFYSESRSEDGTTKVGHEYWLRYYKGGQPEGTAFKGLFNYPDAITGGDAKTVNNTFLWDYYYQAVVGHNQQDKNTDTYQTYYNEPRTFSHYPLLAAGTPYIIGFPGTTYYEFDLSGVWRAQNTYGAAPAKLDKQVITFASATGATIAISDSEQGVTQNDYTFKTNYLNQTLTADYLMNDDGNAFKKVPNGQTGNAIAFRPYFVAVGSPAPATRSIQQIIFDSDDSSFAIGDEDPSEGDVSGGLLFSVKRHAVVVTSSLRREADVRIVNTRGQIIASFDIQPGETIETPVHNSGVYIIQAAGGHYTKKLAVK